MIEGPGLPRPGTRPLLSSMERIKAVIFDWGDTLMRVRPEFEGPMADWPELELMPGVLEALEAISARYLCCVGSNAGPSDADLMRQAFVRVGIDAYFDYLFTHLELDALKPDRRFFLRLARRLDLRPERCLMVGDDFVADIAGAKAAGMKTVWYRPAGVPRPIPPQADAVVLHLADLPETIAALEKKR